MMRLGDIAGHAKGRMPWVGSIPDRGLARLHGAKVPVGGVVTTVGKAIADLLDSPNGALKEMRAAGALAALESRWLDRAGNHIRQRGIQG